MVLMESHGTRHDVTVALGSMAPVGDLPRNHLPVQRHGARFLLSYTPNLCLCSFLYLKHRMM